LQEEQEADKSSTLSSCDEQEEEEDTTDFPSAAHSQKLSTPAPQLKEKNDEMHSSSAAAPPVAWLDTDVDDLLDGSDEEDVAKEDEQDIDRPPSALPEEPAEEEEEPLVRSSSFTSEGNKTKTTEALKSNQRREELSGAARNRWMSAFAHTKVAPSTAAGRPQLIEPLAQPQRRAFQRGISAGTVDRLEGQQQLQQQQLQQQEQLKQKPKTPRREPQAGPSGITSRYVILELDVQYVAL